MNHHMHFHYSRRSVFDGRSIDLDWNRFSIVLKSMLDRFPSHFGKTFIAIDFLAGVGHSVVSAGHSFVSAEHCVCCVSGAFSCVT